MQRLCFTISMRESQRGGYFDRARFERQTSQTSETKCFVYVQRH